MSRSKGGDNTIQVEITINGVKTSSRRMVLRKTCLRIIRGLLRLKPYRIDNPQSGNPAPPLFQCGAHNCIESTGKDTSATATTVYAQVYQGADQAPPSSPPGTAKSDTPAGDGSWSFTRLKNNALPVPDGVCDQLLGGADNCTLVVWYYFADVGSYTHDNTNFHAYCP
jgi:hypothetical protein